MSSETLTASTGIQAQEAEEAEKVGVGAYISLFFAVCLDFFGINVEKFSNFRCFFSTPLAS